MKALLFAFTLIVSGSSVADPMANNEIGWLKAMAAAAHNMNYSGTFIYQNGVDGQVQISRITHVIDAEGEHERLEGLNGAKREMVSSKNQTWLYLGDRKVKIRKRHGEKTFPALLPQQFSTLQENYLIRQVDEDRMAGFHVHAVLFKPKDNLRYAHKMWAHSDTGLLLKAMVLDDKDRMIEQYAFTQLSLGRDVDRSWISPAQSSISVPDKESSAGPQAADMNTHLWQVGALPSGFKRVVEVCRPVSEHAKPVVHLVFSDGLAGISVFIEEFAGQEPPNMGLSSRGALQFFRKTLGNHLITVVGEVPPQTVMQVADSVRYTGS